MKFCLNVAVAWSMLCCLALSSRGNDRRDDGWSLLLPLVGRREEEGIRSAKLFATTFHWKTNFR